MWDQGFRNCSASDFTFVENLGHNQTRWMVTIRQEGRIRRRRRKRGRKERRRRGGEVGLAQTCPLPSSPQSGRRLCSAFIYKAKSVPLRSGLSTIPWKLCAYSIRTCPLVHLASPLHAPLGRWDSLIVCTILCCEVSTNLIEFFEFFFRVL